MTLGGLGFIFYALIFFIRNFTGSFLELGITATEVNVGKSEIIAFSPSLYNYISHLHVAVSGFIAAAGLAVVFLSWYGVRKGEMWAWMGAVATPVLGLAVALPLHYVYGFATWGHLGLIYADTLLFVIGAIVTLIGLNSS